MNILNKIRSLSEKKRKIILWIVMLIVAIFLFSVYVKNMQNTLKENEGKELFDSSYFQKIKEQANEAIEIIFDNINKSKE